MLMSPKKDEIAVHCCDSTLSVLVMFDVSKRLSLSISLLVYCLSLLIDYIRIHGIGLELA